MRSGTGHFLLAAVRGSAMRGARLTILRLKGLVVLIAVMLASLMHSSEAVAACLQTGSLMVLLAAVLGAVFN